MTVLSVLSMILGMMVGSFYAIIQGPTTLEIPKAAMNLGNFQILPCLIGAALMCFITQLGDAGMIWIVLAVILLLIPKTRKTGIVIMAALCIDLVLCNGILKNLFARMRPCDVNTQIQLLIARPDDFSFPSGHTAASFAVVAALYFSGETKLWKPALALACLIAFSRLYLYVHYPTDILGGIFAGLAAGYMGYAIIRQCSKTMEFI